MKLDDAINEILSTYKPLDMVVRGLAVDPKEVSERLAAAEKGSEEHFALSLLAKQYPYVAKKVTKE